MKNYSRSYPVLALALILLLSSCSSNLFTGRKFDLDLVKVEKKKPNEISRKDSKTTEIKSNDAILASSELGYVEIEKPTKIENWESSTLNGIDQTKNEEVVKSSKSKENQVNNNLTKKAKPNKPSSPKDGSSWDWASIVSLSAGVLGLFTAPILFGVVAIVFGAIGMSRTSKGKGKGKGFAIAGLVLGIIEVLILFLVIGLLVAAAA
jgi:hypothetical protein